MKDFFANAGIGPDTRFCVHGVPTPYTQNIHSLFSGGLKRMRDIVPKPAFSSRLIPLFRSAIQAP
jgi:hypothetical protein